MILDFIIICAKFVGFLILLKFIMVLLILSIEMFFKRKEIPLYKSNFYTYSRIILQIANFILHVLLYAYLVKTFGAFYGTEILSRKQLLFLFIPLLIGISLMIAIAKESDRKFKPDFSNQNITNSVSAFIDSGLLTLVVLQLILLFFPSTIKYVASFYYLFL
ncbi:hypothetical protein [Flavobacterium sp. TSSA_36]|uniref:hypothetical protein n=1 Tax=Flavobacterium sp. TSSA_36 TaxID=3447669 RepID=UPI003F3158AA